METEGLNNQEMMTIYEWIDSIELSREKKNIARDFCDGVLLAEIIKHYHPRLVELHNYPSACSTKQKLSNWNTLCLKVFKKIKMTMSQAEIEDVINSKPKAIEKILLRLYYILVKHEPNVNVSRMNKSSNVVDGNVLKLQEEIESVDKEIKEMNERKEQLEKELKEVDDGNSMLQRKVEELIARFEYNQPNTN